jgi:pSer/pThr/pTyr-binding forkhead associated (FHA) protein
MTAKLQVTDGKSSGSELALQGKAIFEIGRAKTADLSLDDPDIAATHLKVYAGSGDFSIFDVSGQGFLHNGKRTLKSAIQDGDEIQIGKTKLRLSKIGAAPPPAPEPAAAPAEPESPPILTTVKGNDIGKQYDLRQKEMFIIGRGVATDITVWDIRVSRVHCRIDRDENGFLITDLNASNGTYVNGRKIETHRLRPGDEIKVGSTVLQYVQQ